MRRPRGIRRALLLLVALVCLVDGFSSRSNARVTKPSLGEVTPLEPLRLAFRTPPSVPTRQSVKLSQNEPRIHPEDWINKASPLWSQNRSPRSFWYRMRSRSQRCMQKVLQWQATRRRTVLAAAAIALSVLFASNQQLETYGSDNPNDHLVASVNRVNMEILQPSHTAGMTSKCHDGASVGLPRGGGSTKAKANKAEEVVVTASRETTKTLTQALEDLFAYMQGPKSDTLLLLLATALITPFCKRFGTSPILGFLASGMLLGPNGCGLISGIHTTETMAELGIVFFLFEMGIELSVERLISMRKDVFGLGLSQFVLTSLAVAGIGKLVGLPSNALVVLGGGLALSSSAFVLQLLKDKDQLATRFGKAAFGVLLFQDLAVVPLLVVTPILAGSGQGLASAVGSALVKAAMALASIAFAGRYLLNPLFKTVASAQSQEAFLGLILLTVLSMSFMTEGLGLSNTLGAFLAGVLLSETKYRYQVEADIAPFRGILLGLFFVTVGFEIDVGLIAGNLPLVSVIVTGIILTKALVTALLSLLFGLSLSTSQQTGLILAQGGEFAFVAFGLARNLGILDKPTTKLMLTCVSLTMALTPALSTLGTKVAKSLEEKSDFTHYLGQDRDASEIKESDDFAVVVGYGAVGKIVCELLDRKLVKYVGLEIDPNKAIQARNKGLPVFYGDIGRQEVAEAFNVRKAKAVVVCISDKAMANRAVIALRRWYPDLKIFARAVDADHASRLQKTLDVAAMVPILPEDNLLLTLPFGGAVLKSLGAPAEEVNAILETMRKEVLSPKVLEEDEEKMELLQLGIEPEKKEAERMENQIDVEIVSPSEMEEEADEDTFKSTVEAAAERLGETKESSPFVAQVIEGVCPESAVSAAECEDYEEGCEVEPEVVEGQTPFEIIDLQPETKDENQNLTDSKLAATSKDL